MPVSSKLGKSWTREWVIKNNQNINSVLDLGCGAGTYIKLFKEKTNLLSHATWTGIEVWEPYITQYKLSERYHTLINHDIRNLDFFKLGKFDLCFLGDVLEHMTKEESVEVVMNVLNYCKYVIVSIPVVHMPQGIHENNPYEIHVKDDWSDIEVKETFPHIIESTVDKKIGVYLLKK
jgi:SAM-dependent methyltransferase